MVNIADWMTHTTEIERSQTSCTLMFLHGIYVPPEQLLPCTIAYQINLQLKSSLKIFFGTGRPLTIDKYVR